MFKNHFLLVLSSLILCTSFAFASDKEEFEEKGSYLIARDNNFIKCIAEKKTWYKGYLFYWNSSLYYSRKIYAVPMEYLNRANVFGNNQVVHCKNWRKLHSLLADRPDIKSFAVEANEFNWSKYPVRESDKTSLIQAESGAQEFATLTPGEYWKKYLNREFVHSDNKALTERFGPFYSSLVFRESIMQQPGNTEFWDKIRTNFAQDIGSFFTSRRDKLKILIAPGYMEDPRDSKVQMLIDVMRGLGLEVGILEMNSLSDLERNAKDALKSLLKERDSRKDIFLMGTSKGSGEILAALSLAKEKNIDVSFVKAFVSLSGTVRGSFLADWILKPVIFKIAKPILESEAKKTGTPFTDLRPGLQTQSTGFLNSYFDGRVKYMPRDTPFYQVIGVPSRAVVRGNDGFMRMLADYLWDSIFFPPYSANDGFLEYPYNSVPNKWNYPSKSIVVNGSHMLTDGYFEGVSLDTPQGLTRFIASYLKTIAEDRGL